MIVRGTAHESTTAMPIRAFPLSRATARTCSSSWIWVPRRSVIPPASEHPSAGDILAVADPARSFPEAPRKGEAGGRAAAAARVRNCLRFMNELSFRVAIIARTWLEREILLAAIHLARLDAH